MNSIEKIIARELLQINAVKLNVEKPFVWASGWHSPIYCDNRITLSYPDVRKRIYESLTDIVQKKFKAAEVIAGVATGAIAHGVLVAEKLNKPFVYVRPAPKTHGLGNIVEGELPPGSKVVVIEDLISTGGSSLAAVDVLRKAGADVLGMAAIFSYGFATPRRSFEKSDCVLYTLTNYITLIEEALACGYIAAQDIETLKQWREHPDEWK
ncbi:MAG: orotate phosphoribosyltransferase [Prevotellaceae bacterium]|jgi:orotate phosphoribosyltransferase|nr:orotate phosphoribosyltransferase [Prevotellaceae bacterium]